MSTTKQRYSIETGKNSTKRVKEEYGESNDDAFAEINTKNSKRVRE